RKDRLRAERAGRVRSRHRDARAPGRDEGPHRGGADRADAAVRHLEHSRPNGGSTTMPKYVIERDIPGAGKLASSELHGIAQKSCNVLTELGPQVQWVESFVTDDKVYCVYIAPGEDAIRKHAQMGGFPANRISRIRRMIDPTTSE